MCEFQGNPLYQATKRCLNNSKMMKNEMKSLSGKKEIGKKEIEERRITFYKPCQKL